MTITEPQIAEEQLHSTENDYDPDRLEQAVIDLANGEDVDTSQLSNDERAIIEQAELAIEGSQSIEAFKELPPQLQANPTIRANVIASTLRETDTQLREHSYDTKIEFDAQLDGARVRIDALVRSLDASEAEQAVIAGALARQVVEHRPSSPFNRQRLDQIFQDVPESRVLSEQRLQAYISSGRGTPGTEVMVELRRVLGDEHFSSLSKTFLKSETDVEIEYNSSSFNGIGQAQLAQFAETFSNLPLDKQQRTFELLESAAANFITDDSIGRIAQMTGVLGSELGGEYELRAAMVQSNHLAFLGEHDLAVSALNELDVSSFVPETEQRALWNYQVSQAKMSHLYDAVSSADGEAAQLVALEKLTTERERMVGQLEDMPEELKTPATNDLASAYFVEAQAMMDVNNLAGARNVLLELSTKYGSQLGETGTRVSEFLEQYETEQQFTAGFRVMIDELNQAPLREEVAFGLGGMLFGAGAGGYLGAHAAGWGAIPGAIGGGILGGILGTSVAKGRYYDHSAVTAAYRSGMTSVGGLEASIGAGGLAFEALTAVGGPVKALSLIGSHGRRVLAGGGREVLEAYVRVEGMDVAANIGEAQLRRKVMGQIGSDMATAYASFGGAVLATGGVAMIGGPLGAQIHAINTNTEITEAERAAMKREVIGGVVEMLPYMAMQMVSEGSLIGSANFGSRFETPNFGSLNVPPAANDNHSPLLSAEAIQAEIAKWDEDLAADAIGQEIPLLMAAGAEGEFPNAVMMSAGESSPRPVLQPVINNNDSGSKLSSLPESAGQFIDRFQDPSSQNSLARVSEWTDQVKEISRKLDEGSIELSEARRLLRRKSNQTLESLWEHNSDPEIVTEVGDLVEGLVSEFRRLSPEDAQIFLREVGSSPSDLTNYSKARDTLEGVLDSLLAATSSMHEGFNGAIFDLSEVEISPEVLSAFNSSFEIPEGVSLVAKLSKSSEASDLVHEAQMQREASSILATEEGTARVPTLFVSDGFDLQTRTRSQLESDGVFTEEGEVRILVMEKIEGQSVADLMFGKVLELSGRQVSSEMTPRDLRAEVADVLGLDVPNNATISQLNSIIEESGLHPVTNFLRDHGVQVNPHVIKILQNTVETLHENGLTHGDIHEGNIMIAGDPTSLFSDTTDVDVVMIDFGTASLTNGPTRLSEDEVLADRLELLLH